MKIPNKFLRLVVQMPETEDNQALLNQLRDVAVKLLVPMERPEVVMLQKIEVQSFHSNDFPNGESQT